MEEEKHKALEEIAMLQKQVCLLPHCPPLSSTLPSLPSLLFCQVEQLVPEAEGNEEAVKMARKRACLLEKDLETKQEEIEQLKEEKEEMEREVNDISTVVHWGM